MALTAAQVPDPVHRLFTQAWCLHELLLRRLSLPERSRQLPPDPPATATGVGGLTWQEVQCALAACLDAFHSTAATLLSRCESSRSCSSSNGGGNTSGSAAAQLADCPSMADWLDGRLLHVAARALWQGQQLEALPAEEQAELSALSQAVQQAAAACGSSSSAAPGALTIPPGPQHSGVPAAQPAKPAPAQPQPEAAALPPPQASPLHSNALVAAICQGVGSGPSTLVLHVAGGTHSEGTPYAADYHWHSGEGACLGSFC